MLLLLFFIFVSVHGQLSVDELFFFQSKYTSTGDCNDFKYTFKDFQIKSNSYNQVVLNCNSSSIVFRNTDYISSSICPDDENYFENLHLRFRDLSNTFIEANQVFLSGIELASLDNLVQNTYAEYSYYRSEWALLINLENHNGQEKYHIAVARNAEMTFMLLILGAENNRTLKDYSVELVFPYSNIFTFEQSSINVWRIDPGYVRSPYSIVRPDTYQLSKSKFTLFNNETFLLYGTQISYPRRFFVLIDETRVECNYDYILQCRFPILPSNRNDLHQPRLTVFYNGDSRLNSTLTLFPRNRLHQVPINHSITDIGSFNVTINENLCM